LAAIRNLRQLAARVAADEALQKRVSADPVKELERLALTSPEPLRQDYFIYRFVVVVLGVLLLAVAGDAIYLNRGPEAVELPDVLISLGSASIGALAGLLAPSPLRT
jgi:hypothetical protein